MTQRKKGLFQIPNKCMTAAHQELQLATVLPFGDRCWEAFLMQQQDMLAKNQRSLGHMILNRILEVNREAGGPDYGQRLRRALTVGVVPLYEFWGRALPTLTEDDLLILEIVYPGEGAEGPEELAKDMYARMRYINGGWQSWFQRIFTEADLNPTDCHFVLLVIRTVIDGIQARFAANDRMAREVQASQQNADVPMPTIEPTLPEYVFDDIGGYKNIKQQLREVVQMFKHQELMQSWAVVVPRGILLAGPSGVGKTMYAHALAHEIERPFFNIRRTDVTSSFVNASARRIDHLFDDIRKANGGVVFFDEVDGLLFTRDNRYMSGEDQKIITVLNQNLQRPKKPDGILIVMATNRRDLLDTATIRAGRIDLVLEFTDPSPEDRAEIILSHIRKANAIAGRPLFQKLPRTIIDQTAGFSGADLAEIIQRALRQRALVAIHQTSDTLITSEEILGVIDEYRKRLLSKKLIGFEQGKPPEA